MFEALISVQGSRGIEIGQSLSSCSTRHYKVTRVENLVYPESINWQPLVETAQCILYTCAQSAHKGQYKLSSHPIHPGACTHFSVVLAVTLSLQPWKRESLRPFAGQFEFVVFKAVDDNR